MNVLISTLKEELATAMRLENKYLKKIKELPRGSFITRVIRGKQYGYLTFRENDKVKQEYLGSLNEERTSFYKNAMNQRAEYKRKLKSVREQIKIINRALRGKTKQASSPPADESSRATAYRITKSPSPKMYYDNLTYVRVSRSDILFTNSHKPFPDFLTD